VPCELCNAKELHACWRELEKKTREKATNERGPILELGNCVEKIEMKAKALFCSTLFTAVLLLAASDLWAQGDLSKYRTFSLGTSLAGVLKHTGQRVDDAKLVHGSPALIQELTWSPSSTFGRSLPFEGVEQILFSFYSGELYKISVEYDRASTEGLTAEDMVRSISKTYGTATNIAPETDSAASDRYELRQKNVASWEDAQYSFNLVRSTFTDRFQLIIYSKKVNADAELATAQAIRLEEQEEPKREAARQKKDADNLALTRQKNQKTFRP
jgi:hypothetical protein